MTAGPITLPRQRILVGDVGEHLRALPSSSVDVAITSPPYFRLRNYGHPDQLGLEEHVDDWVANMRDVANAIARVLVPTGTLWLNLGDTYATHARQGAPRKSLALAPERLALALQTDGWIIRNKIIWAKTNPMPSNVKDRLACTYEVIYVLARQPRYFFDLDAIRVPHRSKPSGSTASKSPDTQGAAVWRGPNSDAVTGLDVLKAEGRVGHPLGKNPGDVWHLATSSYRSDHHATYPVTLAERAIRAGCPEARCSACREPWRRAVIRSLGGTAVRASLSATCDCNAPSEPGLVLDPFIGSGSTAIAAENLGRDWLGIELNPEFVALANRRIAAERDRRGGAGDTKGTAA